MEWNMDIVKAEFVVSNATVEKCPKPDRYEYAFIGRSNVGKSSLINMLTNNKKLAKTAARPGKTQLINHFLINDMWYMVDLPGYGYARTSMETREKWGKMIEKYLHTSKMLKHVFLLVDIRHEPSANDVNMYDWIKYQGFTPVVIATKADKLNRSQIPKQVKLVRETLGMGKEEILIPFSAETKQGRDEIWNIIEGES
mgnify:CR=1 FL=1